MAGSSSKRKKKAKTPPTKSIVQQKGLPASYVEMYERIVRKHLEFLGLDPDLFDRLNKRTKKLIMFLKSKAPTFIVAEDQSVPKIYSRVMNEYMYRYLRSTAYGDVEGYTNMDYYLVGRPFDVNIKIFFAESSLPSDQEEMLRPVLEAIDSDEIKEKHQKMISFLERQIVHITNIYSRVNFRYYYVLEEFSNNVRVNIFYTFFYVYSVEGERKVFEIDRISRVGIRLGVFKYGASTTWIDIERGKINGTDSKELLPVYVQGHVLQRMKERMNISAGYRNISIFHSFKFEERLKLESDIHGRKIIPAYDHLGVKIGYFPFSIIDNCVILLSFLPLTATSVKEGNALQTLLNLQKKDISYWGMDKLRFFLENDLESIPVLKNAMQEAGIWHLTEIRTTDNEYMLPEEKKVNKLLEKYLSTLTMPPE